jgi:glycosyltransferase involved in cell wall biosynthesis
LSYYPELISAEVQVAYCGVDKTIFAPVDNREVDRFISKYKIRKPYFIMTGDRTQHKGYKNSKIFFDAVSSLKGAKFDIMCVGGEEQIERAILESMPEHIRISRVELGDDELAKAYSGATALVYPSLYEGFGMPVVEAMACGCPVITTNRGSLREVAAGAAYIIEGHSIEEMRIAIETLLTDVATIERLRKAGLERAAAFSWGTIADAITKGAIELVQRRRRGEFDEFFNRWSQLRGIQAELDVNINPDGL